MLVRLESSVKEGDELEVLSRGMDKVMSSLSSGSIGQDIDFCPHLFLNVPPHMIVPYPGQFLVCRLCMAWMWQCLDYQIISILNLIVFNFEKMNIQNLFIVLK